MSYEMYKCIEIDKKIIIVHVIQVIAKRIIHSMKLFQYNIIYILSQTAIELFQLDYHKYSKISFLKPMLAIKCLLLKFTYFNNNNIT